MVRLKPIRMEEAARYLGYGSKQPDEVILSLMRECEQPLLTACHPAYSYGIFDVEAANPELILLRDCALRLTGKDIVKHLEGCQKAVIMAATLGSGVDQLLRQLQVSSMPKALLTDAMAGAAIEQICDDIQEEIRAQLPMYRQTWRFSPGYGDLPLSLQETLLSVVEAGKRIGLTATKSQMLSPAKSVTAIIGLQSLEEISGALHLTVPEEAGAAGCGTPEGCSRCRFGGSCGLSAANQNEEKSEK